MDLNESEENTYTLKRVLVFLDRFAPEEVFQLVDIEPVIKKWTRVTTLCRVALHVYFNWVHVISRSMTGACIAKDEEKKQDRNLTPVKLSN